MAGRRRGSAQELVARPVTRAEGEDQKAKALFKVVCELTERQKGTITLGDIINTNLIRVNDEMQLVSFLQKYPSLFILHKLQVKRGTVWVVIPKTQLSVCDTHASQAGSCLEYCGKLHACKFFLDPSKTCRFSATQGSKSCRFGHNLHTNHNQSVLSLYMLDGLTDNQIKSLLMGRSTVPDPRKRLPEICHFYNVGGNGCRNAAQGEICPHLHVCKHYINGTCTFGKRCKRNHDLNSPEVRASLTKHDLDETDVEELLKMLGVMSIDSEKGKPLDKPTGYGVTSSPVHNPAKGTQSPSSPMFTESNLHAEASPKLGSIGASPDTIAPPSKEGDEDRHKTDAYICSYFLRGTCKFSNACFNHHACSNLPFQWQIHSGCQSGWEDVPPTLNGEMEEAFSDGNCGSLPFKAKGRMISLNFDTFELREGDETSPLRIRRISTKTISDSSHDPLSTVWRWYWKDNDHCWLLYGEKGENDSTAKITGTEIENWFQENPKGKYDFGTGMFEYVMDLENMAQKNKQFGTERPVRRRPVFVTSDEVAEKIKKANERVKLRGTETVNLPTCWKIDASYKDDYCKIELKKTGETLKEYEEIEKFFLDTVHDQGVTVKSIHRIQNLEALERFESKKRWMTKRSSLADPNNLEKRLFHGTRQKYVEVICQQGFDFRMCGSSTGTKFGKGSYFATNASYSKCYTNSGEVFVVRVLVGDYAPGSPQFTRPPPKDPSNPTGQLFDSCVNQMEDPTMFIVFTLEQAYPEYLVKFE